MLNLQRHWYRDHSTLTLALLPFSWLFYTLVTLRRFLYQKKLKKTYYFSAPVIVVGNITVGGTGKTPLVVWLAHYLKKQGYRPGIVSRGVGGKRRYKPRWVNENADPRNLGDEAVLLARRTNCPMVVGIDRVAAVKELLEKTNCNVVISDDGLQHYRLGRHVEIAVIDGARRFGNGSMLPAGPLREPQARLQQTDFIVTQGQAEQNEFAMHLQGSYLVSVADENKKVFLDNFRDKKVHAVAAIGNPERFFATLREKNLSIIEHRFSDHYHYQARHISFEDELPVIMTEKDAVKCKSIADERHWFLPVEAKIDERFGVKLLEKLTSNWRQHA